MKYGDKGNAMVCLMKHEKSIRLMNLLTISLEKTPVYKNAFASHAS